MIDISVSILFIIISAILWYWVCFRGGAEKWRKSLIQYQTPHLLNFYFHPTSLKVITTIVLLSSLVAFIGLMINKYG